jgi:hypothetical protein
MGFVYDFSEKTRQDIARHVRAMLKGIKRRPKTAYELATALAAAKIVVATLSKMADEAGLPEDVVAGGDQLAADARGVMDLVRGW